MYGVADIIIMYQSELSFYIRDRTRHNSLPSSYYCARSNVWPRNRNYFEIFPIRIRYAVHFYRSPKLWRAIVLARTSWFVYYSERATFGCIYPNLIIYKILCTTFGFSDKRLMPISRLYHFVWYSGVLNCIILFSLWWT